MRVIKSGDGRKGWARELDCTGDGNGDGGCGARLLVEQNDVFWTNVSNGYCEPSSRTATFRCPECGRPTDIGTVPFDPREATSEEKAVVYRR